MNLLKTAHALASIIAFKESMMNHEKRDHVPNLRRVEVDRAPFPLRDASALPLYTLQLHEDKENDH